MRPEHITVAYIGGTVAVIVVMIVLCWISVLIAKFVQIEKANKERDDALLRADTAEHELRLAHRRLKQLCDFIPSRHEIADALDHANYHLPHEYAAGLNTGMHEVKRLVDFIEAEGIRPPPPPTTPVEPPF